MLIEYYEFFYVISQYKEYLLLFLDAIAVLLIYLKKYILRFRKKGYKPNIYPMRMVLCHT